MQKPRAGPKGGRAKKPPFEFDKDTRLRLAETLRRDQDARRSTPAAIREVIRAIEARAREFVETKVLAIENSDAKVREAIQQLQLAVTRTGVALGALPPKARTALTERLLLERGEAAGTTLAQARENMRLLRYAAQRALSDGAPNPKGGRPVDQRGQQLAADTALILSDSGIVATSYVDGPVARILSVVFEAVGHRPGDMRTLLDGLLAKLGDIPPKTF